ncbi:hypothetical protein ACQP3D_30220, partial [Escherichia coli]
IFFSVHYSSSIKSNKYYLFPTARMGNSMKDGVKMLLETSRHYSNVNLFIILFPQKFQGTHL